MLYLKAQLNISRKRRIPNISREILYLLSSCNSCYRNLNSVEVSTRNL